MERMTIRWPIICLSHNGSKVESSANIPPIIQALVIAQRIKHTFVHIYNCMPSIRSLRVMFVDRTVRLLAPQHPRCDPRFAPPLRR